MMYRLEPGPDQWLNRSVGLSFEFEGEQCRGFAGDTISSALAAAGLPYLARSFKYHRPRHLLSYANHDSNALFQVNGTPNVRGDVTALREGMRVTAVNTFGGLRNDKARVLNRLGRFLPVGFYYKAFHHRRWFPRWERMFRALTGLGVVSFDAPRLTSAKRYGFCDVLIIGAGPSGLGAALAAAEAGARVTLVEESVRLGGSGLETLGDQPATRRLIDAVAACTRITVASATVAAGYYADHWVALVDADRLTKMRAKAVVFACGVIAQPAVFRNNDLPGVMLAAAASRLVMRQGVAPGRRVVIVAGNSEAYRTCLDLQAQGVCMTALLDMRAAVPPEDLDDLATCEAAGVAVLRAHVPYEAVADRQGRLVGLRAAAAGSDGRVASTRLRLIECDAVLMSVGWAAAANLFLQAGGNMRFAPALQQNVPSDRPAGIFTAGRLNGVFDFSARLADGTSAGVLAAAHARGQGIGETVAPPTSVEESTSVAQSTRNAVRTAAPRCPSHPFPIVDHPAGKNFVDFDEDLQVKDLENAAQEGFDSSELLKRYSTVGMGPSQGKHSNMNALRILARYRKVGVERLGLTTSRPMYHPVPLKLLAGRSFSAERRTPLDARHAALGAVWMPAGNWRRPEFYAVPGTSRLQCIDAEVRAVRSTVGLIDVGTLGKIEVHGPQAGHFLDRLYTGNIADLKVGMSRYGLLLDEAGVIVDDGVIARLRAETYYFTTTTGGSASVFREMLRLNAQWGLDCALVNVTGHRAALNLAGPASRDVLQPFTDVNLAAESFSYQAVRSGRVAGVAARLLRVGFVGELGFEIHVATGNAPRVWDALLAAGKAAGLRPFGVEAQRVLRLEKGHFIVGQDTDGLTDPFEANAAWAVNMKKPFFVGQRSLAILQRRGPRQLLVGFELLDAAHLPRECHLIIKEGCIVGRVTSIVRSSTLGKGIGLAMLSPELAREGGEIEIRGDGGATLRARIVPTPFYDAKNSRQRALPLQPMAVA